MKGNIEFRENKKNPFNYRMYDVDGNGVIDQDEMTKIIQVRRTQSSLRNY